MWDLRYRPLRFSDVLGQAGTVEVLKARLRKKTAFSTSYIFAGGSGQGKTTLARIFARAMLCERLSDEAEPCNVCDPCQAVLSDVSPAFVERDAASQGTIDNARAIVEELPFAVLGAPKRIYLFDECHRMSVGAQDAFLKPLEEGRFVGMFCTTEPEKIRTAIRGRCEMYTVRKITPEEVFDRLRQILVTESVEYEEDALRVLVDSCGGHMRDAIKRLEGVAQLGPITLERTKTHLNVGLVSTYYEILLKIPNDVRGALKALDAALERVTPEEVAAGLADAAIDSFRLAHQMTADFTYVDRTLAQNVYALYAENTPKIAEYFLRSRPLSPTALVCDLLSIAQGLGTAFSAPLDEPAPLPPSFPVRSASAPVSTPELVQAPLAPIPIQEPPKPLPPKIVSGRPDGVGNLGQDPQALTVHDAEVIPADPPKRANRVREVIFHDGPVGGKKILTPGEWRRIFESLVPPGSPSRDAS